MRSLLLLLLMFLITSLVSTGCTKAPPAAKTGAASGSEVVLKVTGMT